MTQKLRQRLDQECADWVADKAIYDALMNTGPLGAAQTRMDYNEEPRLAYRTERINKLLDALDMRIH